MANFRDIYTYRYPVLSSMRTESPNQDDNPIEVADLAPFFTGPILPVMVRTPLLV